MYLWTPDELEMQRLMMLNMDPPEHAKLRKLVNRGFTPRRIRELQEVLARRATTIVDEVIEAGSCDMVEAVAAELPLQAIAEFLGVPQEDRHLVFKWSNTMIGSDDPEYASEKDEAGQTAETMAASAELYAYAQGLAEDRRANPRDDIVSDLVQAEIDGDVLSDTDFNLFFLLLAVAGNETTRNAISHSVLALAENPDQRAWLREDPTRWDSAAGGDAALVHPGHALPPDGHPGRRAGRAGHRRGRPGRDLAHLGQPGRGRVHRSLHASTSGARPTSTSGRPATSPSAAAARTSASAPTWPGPRCG